MADEEIPAVEANPEAEVAPAVETTEVPNGDGGDAPIAEAPKPADPPKNKDMPKWGWDRLHEESNKRKIEEAARQQLEKENAALKEMMERLQRGDTSPPATQTSKREVASPDFEHAVQREAEKRSLAQARDGIIRSGYEEFGKAKFDESANVLAALNCVSDDFISDVLAVDGSRAHKLLAKIASDPEKAATLSAMDSRNRIAELTRIAMSDKEAPKSQEAPTPKPASKAPPPKPQLDPIGGAGDPNDLMDENISDDEFFRRWKKKQQVA